LKTRKQYFSTEVTSKKEQMKYKMVVLHLLNWYITLRILINGTLGEDFVFITSPICVSRFQEAEDDCTEALNLDDRYIKAYSRRATARKELGKNKESMEGVLSCNASSIHDILICCLNTIIQKHTDI
jgi:hypothetical protein